MIAKTLVARAFGITCLLVATTAVQADLRVRFIEGAPKDKFVFENVGDCPVSDTTVLLDLSTARGKLIFDVTSQGAGVEVFQPFELVEGRDALVTLPTVRDGQASVELEIASLDPSAAIAFTIDVDDTLGQREITVSGTEIEGATVYYANAKREKRVLFNASADALLAVAGC